MLDWSEYLAYEKYKNGIFSGVPNINDLADLNSNINSLIAYKILRQTLIYVPVDTGNLRKSIYIRPYDNGFVIGTDCSYAIYVHEIGANYHKPPTQYKYLEDAAFEVITSYKAETGIELPVTIEYNPLRVFIGVDNSPGESLTGVKAKEKQLTTPEAYQRLWDDFINFDVDAATDADLIYFEKMYNFFEYYKNTRHFNTMAILNEWADRLRHKLI